MDPEPIISPVNGRLIYDEAIRRLAAQDADLTNIRTRAGTLIAGISIVTGFLAGPVLSMPGAKERPLTWAALGFFVISLGLALFVLVHPVGLQSGYSPREIKSYIAEHAPDPGFLTAHLSIQLEEAVETNRPLLSRLRKAMLWSVLALASEMLLLFLLLGRGVGHG